MRLSGGPIFAVLQRIGHDWAVRCFGAEHVSNVPERGLRSLEEQVELAQAVGVPEDLAHLCVTSVYARPPGDPQQEMGGVLHTAAIMCATMNWDADELHEREVRRVLNKPSKHFTDRNQAKFDLGLKVPAPGSASDEAM
jgi:hypothetical protein